MNNQRLPFSPFFAELIFILWTTFPVWAEPGSYQSRLWQMEEGLPHNTVQTIAQTTEGYLWVGTRSGLARFDGVRFERFDTANVPALKSDSILSLCASRDGTLWIGTETGGLTVFKDGQFTFVNKPDELPHPNIRSLRESADGSIWIGSYSGGLTRFYNGSFTRFTREQGLVDETVRSVFDDRDGNLWIATIWGLSRLKNGVFTNFTEANGLKHNSVRAVCEDREGNIWIGSNGGLSRFHDGHFTHFSKKDGLADNVVSALYLDRSGMLWIGTYEGLTRFESNKFFTETRDSGESYNQVYCIFEDREGNIWVGTREGLNRLKVRHFQTYTKRDGLTHNTITSVFEDKSGTVWIGTGGGLNFFKDGIIRAYTMTNGLRSDLVRGIHEGHDGSLWFGTSYDGGLNRLRQGQFTFYGRPELWDSPENVIHEDRHGNLWLGSPFALNRMKNGQFTRYANNTSPALPHFEITSICEDHNGVVWIGTPNGLARWQNEYFNTEGLQSFVGKRVLSLYEDTEQSLWVAVEKHGLARWKDNRTTFYGIKDGLLDDSIFEILEDEHGFFWMASPKGVFRFRKKDLDEIDSGKIETVICTAFGKEDGMASGECQNVAKPAACRSRDGRLWFATIKGLVTVNPGKIAINTVVPEVRIEKVIANKRPVISLKNSKLTIQPDQKELEFHYTGLSLTTSEKNQFKFKLEGFDHDWIDAGTRRVAYYNNLSPGAYTFRVIASNNDGIWNSSGASVNFYLLPYFWQTWWFRSLSIIAGILLAAMAARFFTQRRMQIRLERLEQQHALEKERARIARDMHDDLGARLTEVLFLNDLVKKSQNTPEGESRVDKISQAIREISRSLNALVWAVNPQNDKVDELVTYIGKYAERFLATTPIRYRLDAPLELPQFSLSSEARHHLFLVVKEALNNIVKHSDASEVQVRFNIVESRLEVAVTDNGKGIDSGKPIGSGNGLVNMKNRIEGLGGRFAMESQHGKGTQVKLSIPL